MQIANTRASRLNIVLLALIITLVSCAQPKKIVYFQNIPDSLSTATAVPVIAFEEPRITVNDILNISVQTIDQKDVVKPGTEGTADETTGYKVDKNGEVDIPLVGTVKLAGLTTAEAKEAVKEKAKKLFVDPVVNIQLASYYFNVVGDVGKPGRIVMPVEKISIIDALALAGDLTIQGKRENIMIIRDDNGKKTFARLDLTSSEIFRSPYYYIKNGDCIYIEPNKSKIRSADPTRERYLSYAISLISLALTTATIIITLNRE